MLANSRSNVVFGRLLRDWWREPVDYAAQVQYFAKRSMAEAIRTLIGFGTAFNGVICLAILMPFAATRTSAVVVAIFGVLQIGWGAAWCARPWPSRLTSLAFVISADFGIATAAIVDSSWLLGLFGFNAFTMISIYLMFFDGPKILAGHLAWILLATATFTARAAAHANFDTTTFTASTLTAVAPVLATPLGIQFGIWALRTDANESVTDALTGLLNRRGLHLHIGELLCDITPRTEVTVMVVDLDRFKDVNDTFGHAVGDEVLIRCARRIKSVVRGSALVARIGGEEFVVVDRTDSSRRARCDLDSVRHAICAPAEHPVTASVGVATTDAAGLAASGATPATWIDSLIERADHAMFRAKRGGGNATVHR
ncbi:MULTISPECIES: diguanylate cyclase [unclassified Mycolicibacterium]|uniref:GGDEF domain-containing protein n=1 Tax=unclassified Mycolicibacterium TaxID=2636767 RepID=UPI0012DCEFE8|nr:MULTISPECIES: GGDEF domain-containing protein [unclassified Mycolicibacterium]MUL80819.1 GGDEF domain-containing protein [Mycolicibacterium sp. CBMA 329]MUL86586.1 GGDEF domain-containing protein [Mycolicibacterium sp. CBMA 331]MUM01447.1 GGDEF domain-containing protein [Mycolicibacterium sp. CBMA 334]MUM27251.1 GGDEF domain-containing protein [Mycolicibacterium sp. CBMA 295]MUM36882.1 GGDEF domain-containing protein [Mycolicibacterium sp. CBMA 247]